MTGSNKNVVCSTSELLSPLLLSSKFKAEYDLCKHTGTNPYMAFEKEFLRYMLSDGASAALLQSRPNSQDKSYKIEWIDMISYADKLPTCMLCGGEQRPDLQVIGWKEFSPFEWGNKSIFSIKQNIKLLQKYAITYFAKSIKYFLEKHQEKHIDFVLPHISSMFFYGQLRQALKDSNIEIGQKGWYTNLPQTGNIGSASILTILNGFTKEKEFNKGDRILLLVPESGRFSYGAVLLTVY